MNADRPELPHDLKSLEADLAALAPASANLPRDELMYRAGWEACAAAATVSRDDAGQPPEASFGRREQRPRGTAAWLWPLTSAALVLVSATLGTLLAVRGEPEVRVVYVEKPAAAMPHESNNSESVASPISTPLTESMRAALGADMQRPRASAVRLQSRNTNDYLSLRDRVLALGVDVLPNSTAPTTAGDRPSDSRYGAMIGRMLGG